MDNRQRKTGGIGGYRPDQAGRTLPGSRSTPPLVPRFTPFAIVAAGLGGGAVILAAVLGLLQVGEGVRQGIKWTGVCLAAMAVCWEGFNRFRAPRGRSRRRSDSEADQGR